MKHGRWRRAKITEVINDNKCLVYLIDYGKSSVVTDADFRNIPEQLADLKPKVLRCVFDIPPGHPINQSQWKDDAFKFMASDR